MSQLQTYGMRIRPLSEEQGGGFLAGVPELPGCMSDGETPQQALDKVHDAIAAWIQAALETGRQIPRSRHMTT